MDRSSTRSPVTWQAVASWYIMCNVLKDWEKEKKKPKLYVAKLRYLLIFLFLYCRSIYVYFMLKQGILCSTKYTGVGYNHKVLHLFSR